VQRNFTPTPPNQVWTGDITYIATDEDWLCLAAVIDLFSRQLVGWSMQPHMKSSLVTDALKMAWFRRQPTAGLILHSDRGTNTEGMSSVYKIRSSIGRKGNCWDNESTKSLWGRMKLSRLCVAEVCNPQVDDR
jgi:transposase InsO family protein